MSRIPFLNVRNQGLGTSIFSTMTALANKHKAVNLGQGFPNFNPRLKLGQDLLEAAARAIVKENRNQYARSFGALELTKAIQKRFKKLQNGLEYDHENEITVFSGATEAIYCSFASLLEVGDEVIVFEPHYDSYRPAIWAAGGQDRVVTLRRDVSGNRFTFDPSELRRAFNPKTRAILINTPNNPTGTVFNREELSLVADLCKEHNVLAIADEVYDSIVFDGNKHISIATLSGMRDRTITISSAGKTFSVTGWKIGWALASKDISTALRTSHQFVTFCSATPFQYALAEVLEKDDESFYKDLVDDYNGKRNMLFDGLKLAGFDAIKPQGTYFIQADISSQLKKYKKRDDVEFCSWMTQEVGVCAIPSSAFYSKESSGNYIRFAFCKTDDVLQEGIARLKKFFS